MLQASEEPADVRLSREPVDQDRLARRELLVGVSCPAVT